MTYPRDRAEHAASARAALATARDGRLASLADLAAGRFPGNAQ